MPKSSNGCKILRAVVLQDGRVQTKDDRRWAGAKVKLETGQEVYVNAGDPDSHEGRSICALGQGERVQVTEKRVRGKVYYDLLTTGDPGQTDAFPEDEDDPVYDQAEPAPRTNGQRGGSQSDRPANPLAESLARNVGQDMAQMRLITTDVLREMKKQGKEPDVQAAISFARTIWLRDQFAAILWDHDIPSALRA